MSPLLRKRDAVLLVTGTCIGAGMLGMPLVIVKGGFFPGLFVNIICWFMMLCTGLLYAELCLSLEKPVHAFSLFRAYLGPIGKAVGILAFLGLGGCFLVAYYAGFAPMLMILDPSYSFEKAVIVSAIVTAFFVYKGTLFLSMFNATFTFCMIASFVILVRYGWSDVNWDQIYARDWPAIVYASPVLLGAYGYQNVVPSINIALAKQRFVLPWILGIGTLIAFLIYITWQFVILGCVDRSDLLFALEAGKSVGEAFGPGFSKPIISVSIQCFAAFALITSVLGVSLSLADFFVDLFCLERTVAVRMIIAIAVTAPPAIGAIYAPNIFLSALGLAGGYGEVLLNGVLPIIMVYFARKKMPQTPSSFRLPGGNLLLAVLLILFLSVSAIEFLHSS